MRAMRLIHQALPILTAVAFLSASAPPALAQVVTDDRVEEELQRTDRALENAGSIVLESRSQRAKDLFQQATRIQAQAWESYRAGSSIPAVHMTLEARRLGVRAVGFARSDDSLEQRARRELEVADTMLRSATEQIAESPSDAAMRLLDEARAQIERGRRQLGEQHFEAAFRLALSAQRLVRQALDVNDGVGEPRRVQRELERTDIVIERAKGPVQESEDRDAILLLDRATSIQRSAWESFHAGQPRVALARTREARNLATRALARLHGPVSQERVADELRNTEQALERAAEPVDVSRDPGAVRVLENARTHQARAYELLRQGELRPALAQTLVARRLAVRAEDLARDGSQ